MKEIINRQLSILIFAYNVFLFGVALGYFYIEMPICGILMFIYMLLHNWKLKWEIILAEQKQIILKSDLRN